MLSNLADVIVGASPAMVALKAYLPKVARSTATVLISGETGTGKECVAQALHALGRRHHGPFVAVNCAALPDSLVESELFGHVRGAFTGAIATSEGYFSRAHGGTLFLDEVGEMSLHGQAKLLRVLETRKVVPLGSRASHDVDVRLIAATNRPLDEQVKLGTFRADLYYRLGVARLELPPLRERPEDVPLLIQHTIEEFNRRDARDVGMPDAELLTCMLAYEWPGNVRELRNLIEVVFIDPPSGRISLADLPPIFRTIFARYRNVTSSERDRVLGVLYETNWNKAEAARQLHWSRMTLYRKLAKYRIDESP